MGAKIEVLRQDRSAGAGVASAKRVRLGEAVDNSLKIGFCFRHLDEIPGALKRKHSSSARAAHAASFEISMAMHLPHNLTCGRNCDGRKYHQPSAPLPNVLCLNRFTRVLGAGSALLPQGTGCRSRHASGT